MVLEAATGFVFLGLIITYMPLLDQAYSGREVGALLLQSRAGKPPGAVRLLRRYAAGPDRAEILRANLREGEHWLADVMQSHLSHPVLCFYRAQHFGQSWLVSLTTLMDTCALLVVGGEGLVREQARLTYRMGLLLLGDLTSALDMSVPARVADKAHRRRPTGPARPCRARASRSSSDRPSLTNSCVSISGMTVIFT